MKGVNASAVIFAQTFRARGRRGAPFGSGSRAGLLLILVLRSESRIRRALDLFWNGFA